MTKPVYAVLAEAQRLDVDARAEVAADLRVSLDGPADPESDAVWAVEVERRVAAIEGGTAKLEPREPVTNRQRPGDLPLLPRHQDGSQSCG